MAIRTCPICQSAAEPLTDAEGKDFCRSCDLQLPPAGHPANATPRPKVVTARPVADDDDDRPRKAKPRVATATVERPTRNSQGTLIAGLVILIAGSLAMIVFFVLVIVIKTAAKPVPTAAPESKATGMEPQPWPGGGPGGFDRDFDRPPPVYQPPPTQKERFDFKPREEMKPEPPKPPR